MQQHRVCALISGGKDSCYSMMCAVQQGHSVVALANLLPPSAETDEMDSWMYQTVGHQAIPNYSRVMGGIPLYRRRIRGSALATSLHYGNADVAPEDEVEDLWALLWNVKQAQPDVTAVCSGAILSTYQRARVENVCARLGLTSLAYLWQQPQRALLDEMIAASLVAVLVKVASLGLDRSHLGSSIEQLRPLLHRLEAVHGVSVCGEGGEYESLTLDCPLFSHSLSLGSDARVVSAGSGAVLLHVITVNLCCKPGGVSTEPPAARIVLCDDAPMYIDAPLPPQIGFSDRCNAERTQCGSYGFLRIVGDDALSICQHLFADTSAIPLCVQIRTNNVSLFSQFNALYGSAQRGGRFPPARAVWQPRSVADCGEIVAEVVYCNDEGSGIQWLHVESISRWAPACIGPYSQLVKRAGGAVWLSGMIPLQPVSMTLVDASMPLVEQLQLCIQHCSAVLRSMGSRVCGESVRSAVLLIDGKHANQQIVLSETLRAALPHAVTIVSLCGALPRQAPIELICVAQENRAPQLETRGPFIVSPKSADSILGFATGPLNASLVLKAGEHLLFRRVFGDAVEIGFVGESADRRSSSSSSDD